MFDSLLGAEALRGLQALAQHLIQDEQQQYRSGRSGACHGGHHDCAAFDVGIAGDEVLAAIRKKNIEMFVA